MFEKSRAFFSDATKNSNLSEENINFLMDVVSLAAEYHDMGKLSDQPQSILRGDITQESEGKMLNHVDAGTAFLLKKYEETKNMAYMVSAFFVHAHHIGLEDFETLIERKMDRTKKLATEIYSPKNQSFRDNRDVYETYGIGTKGLTVKQYIDQNLSGLVEIHSKDVGLNYTPNTSLRDIPHVCTATIFRIAFSCFVDADHTDTESFYSNKKYKPFVFSALNPAKRREYLERHISKISSKSSASPERIESRKLLHDICCNAKIPKNISFFALDGSVGLGKTFSGAHYSLRLAAERKCDRIYSIIPYTNIISQTVQNFKDAMLFENESQYNINEIHSKCEFDHVWMRKYSSKWNAPINVSTMVQFAESLASNKPSRCRKLHWFANSVVFFDEFDKAMAHEYWEFFLVILKELSENFNTTFIFSSGTSAYYWDIFNADINVHHIINKKTYRKFSRLEKVRCKIKRIKDPVLDLNKFPTQVFRKIKSKRNAAIVCNTINNACRLAGIFRKHKKFSEYEIYELTGHQDPCLKESILEKIKSGLKDPTRKILVVSTSTIECGVDISFDIGWREKCGPLNLFQFMGRINREATANDAVCYVFEFHDSLIGKGNPLTENPKIYNSIRVFDESSIRGLSPKKCTSFVEQELSYNNSLNKAKLLNHEISMDFKTMNEEFAVIDSVTSLVIVNKEIVEKIRKGEDVHPTEISRHSVQLWDSRIDKIQQMFADDLISDIKGEGYYAWEGEYDMESGIGKTMILLR